MALAMKERCDKCDDPLEDTGEAYICTFECTYCADCTESLRMCVQIAAVNSSAGRERKNNG